METVSLKSPYKTKPGKGRTQNSWVVKHSYAETLGKMGPAPRIPRNGFVTP
jgi:hypothetical protein